MDYLDFLVKKGETRAEAVILSPANLPNLLVIIQLIQYEAVTKSSFFPSYTA